jgi:hypothetical protein
MLTELKMILAPVMFFLLSFLEIELPLDFGWFPSCQTQRKENSFPLFVFFLLQSLLFLGWVMLL